MKGIKLIALFFVFSFWTNAQEKSANSNDALLKEAIYNENSVKVLNFSLKEFDALFFEFSDRLVALYPDQKEIAAENKKKSKPKTTKIICFRKLLKKNNCIFIKY